MNKSETLEMLKHIGFAISDCLVTGAEIEYVGIFGTSQPEVMLAHGEAFRRSFEGADILTKHACWGFDELSVYAHGIKFFCRVVKPEAPAEDIDAPAETLSDMSGQ